MKSIEVIESREVDRSASGRPIPRRRRAMHYRQILIPGDLLAEVLNEEHNVVFDDRSGDSRIYRTAEVPVHDIMKERFELLGLVHKIAKLSQPRLVSDTNGNRRAVLDFRVLARFLK